MVTGSGKSNQTQTMDVINTESCMPTKMLIESIAIPAYSLTLSGLGGNSFDKMLDLPHLTSVFSPGGNPAPEGV